MNSKKKNENSDDKKEGEKNNTWLNDAAPKQLFRSKQLELLMFEQRMLFNNKGIIDKRITFSSSYFYHNFLPKQIIIEKLDAI